jgi:DNA-binding MarR family transcriptional regulator
LRAGFARELPGAAMSFDLSDFLPYQLAVASSRISRQFAERYKAEFGLTIPEWRVLAHLAQSDAVSVREIHARVDMDKSKVSRAAARLEAAGLIEKRENPEDRRLLDMRLTAKGGALIARIVPIADAYQAELMTLLGPDAKGFQTGLHRLYEER